MAGEDLISNVLINNAIIEFFCLIGYVIGWTILLSIERKKIKYMFGLIFAKTFVFNLIVTYIKIFIADDSELNRIMFFANVFAVLVFFGCAKIITQKEYLRIGISKFVCDIVVSTIIACPYFTACKFWDKSQLDFVGGDVTIKELVILFTIMLVIVLLIYLSQYLYKWFSKHILGKCIKGKVIWWIIVIAENLFLVFKYAVIDIKQQNKVLIMYIIMPVVVILILYEISLWVRKRKEKIIERENRMLNVENTVMKEYYETLEYQLEYTRKFRHDIDKHMTVLKEMIQEKTDASRVTDYATNVQNEYNNLRTIEYCENPVVNAILNNKQRLCTSKGIDMDIRFSDFETGKISDMDLIALISNLLDNAIEECERLDSAKKILLKCGNNAGIMFMFISNTTNKNKIDEKTVTTEKKDKYEHGVGLTIIKDTVEKYDGSIKMSINKGMFEVAIMLNVK